MNRAKEYSCIYGSNSTQDTVYTYETNEGTWYVVRGGTMVNCTYDNLYDGVDVEELQDVDCFTYNEPIKSLDDLIKAVES